MAPIRVRRLESPLEYKQAEALQKSIWGFIDVEVIPIHVLITVQKNGGIVLGAFLREELLGLLVGFAGLTVDGRLKHCSHILGIHPEAQRQGIGALLKWAQRQAVLAQGVDLVTWTYDPLETRNGYFNLHKLGAVCSTYLPNVYGEIRDDLNRGLSTDRFEVHWHLASERVRRREGALVSGPFRGVEAGEVATECRRSEGGFIVPEGWRALDAQDILVEVPDAFQAMKRADLELAKSWRDFSREVFVHYFERGYVAIDVAMTTPANRPPHIHYVLSKNVRTSS